MLLTGQKIQHVNAITHDGKVLCFGTDPEGGVWYTVKRSGFENSAVQDGTDPFGFEGWQKLRLGASTPDASVSAHEQQTLSDGQGTVLVRSVFGGSSEATCSVGPVQLLSAGGLLYVFRQSPSRKILVNRFVLDGMTNQLLPKLEVRFRRSRQKLTPKKSAAAKGGGTFDSLDYRDIDGDSFFEPAYELGFADATDNGWFSVVVVPTAQSDRQRWQLFVYDPSLGKVVLYTVGSGSDGLFDVKDYLYGQQDPANPGSTVYRSIPGIIRRVLDLGELVVAGGLSATMYDVQKEQITDTGPQLMRDTVRVMLAVPVAVAGGDTTKTKTVVVDFALAVDGTLSQIDPTPNSSTILRSDAREVITPLTLLDDIKELADLSPPPAGTIVATERGDDDQLQIRSQDALPADLEAGSRVRVRGTKSYDGHYQVLSVDGANFQVAAVFSNDEVGSWEVVPDKQTGLVFDNMVVGTERTAEGKLEILCPAHDLQVGDEVQISGTTGYDGVFPITAIDGASKGFVLDTAFFTGEAANLSKVVRRGLRMDGNDRVETPELELVPPSVARDLGRTLSAWVRVDEAGTLEQQLIEDSGGMMRLSLGADGKATLAVRMSDNATRVIVDTDALPIDSWHHYAGTIDYVRAKGGETRIALCRDGVEVASQTVGHATPCHLGDQALFFDGAGAYVEVPATTGIGASITVEAWVLLDDPAEASDGRGIVVAKSSGSGEVQFSLRTSGADHRLEAGFLVSGGSWQTTTAPTGLPIGRWLHVAASYDGHVVRLYVDGALAVESADFNCSLPALSGGWYVGRSEDSVAAGRLWKGRIADLRLWSRTRSELEISEGMAQRPSGREAALVGCWPLDSGTAKDLSPAKRHGALQGSPPWQWAAYLYPQIAPPAAEGATLAKVMRFDGEDDHVEVATAASLFADDFSVCAWAKVTGGADSVRTVLSCAGAAFAGISLQVTGDNQWQVIAGDGSTWCAVTGPAVVEGTWTQLACTRSGTTLSFYVDGALQGTATGTFLAPSGPMRIGAGDTAGDTAGAASGHFNGTITDVQVWSGARSEAEIQQGMGCRLSGWEPDLAGYWPLDQGFDDMSRGKRRSALVGEPERVGAGGAHTIGRAFSGELSGVQIWEKAQAAAEVNATMHLPLSGKEAKLAAYYRMGAIVYQESPPIVPDFSQNGSNGVVIGDPYAGARRLHRATGSGMRVVQYGSDELVAVSQRGMYEESFELRVTSPDADFDPNDADGTGRRMFSFSYWGKSSRGSKEILAIPSGSVQQRDFESLGGGWYRASCRVVIPDGMSLMRAFEISQVRGRWGAEATAPATEWTAIDVRRHRIRLVSDAVTRDDYRDEAAVISLPGQSQALLDSLAAMGQADGKVAGFEAAVRDLLTRIDVVQNSQRYVNERNALNSNLASLESQRSAAQSQRAGIIADWGSYYHTLRVKHSGEVADGRDAVLRQYRANGGDFQLFRFVPVGSGDYNIYCKGNEGKPLTSAGGASLYTPASSFPEPNKTVYTILQKWWFAGLGDGYDYIKCEDGNVLDVKGSWTADGTPVLCYPPNGGSNQRWVKQKTNTLTASAQSGINARNNTIAQLNPQITAVKDRLAWLNQLLGANENLADLQALLAAAQASLATARAALAAANAALMSGIAAAPPATMPMVAVDDRNLVTTGAVLDFASPLGAACLTESCEGNVLLTYFDGQGRMCTTVYDAVADSRNAAFEQWLPEAVRACADIRDSGDRITLAQAATLPTNGWTCEAWVRYPVATNDEGQAHVLSAVAASDERNMPLLVRQGERMGCMVDGWYFDSGVDLSRTIASGWHHVAASSSRGTTNFYVDGTKVGSRKTAQSILRMNGTTDYVEVPAHTNPTAAVTVSVWARSAGPTWNHWGYLVSKRDAYIMHPVKDSRMIQFYVFIAGSGWQSVDVTPPDIQGWHQYTGTFDGKYLSLYIDGEPVVDRALTGTIQGSSGVLYLGHDSGNNSYFAGDLSEVAVWSVARGLSDVREDLYRSLTGSEDGLVGYWRMDTSDEGGVIKVSDLTSNARHGVVKGSPQHMTITTTRDMAVHVLGNVPEGGSPIGRLAELRLWSLGLSDAEVGVNARASISGNEPGLVAYWPLNEATGPTAYDRSVGGEAHGGLVGAEWVGCTANMGHPGSKVLGLPDHGGGSVTAPAVALAGKSFTLECWARRSSTDTHGSVQTLLSMGTEAANQGLCLGFRPGGQLTLAFWTDDLDSTLVWNDTDWHHWCASYDQPTKTQRLYCDGEQVGERTATADFSGSGALGIAQGLPGQVPFTGEMAELRIWDRVRSEEELRGSLRRRLSGDEPGLLAYYPMTAVSNDDKVQERTSKQFLGQLNGAARLLGVTSLPLTGATDLVSAEYSSVEVSGEGVKQALMRRFYGFTVAGDVALLPEQRVEQLTLQWVGNTQINPTLLGYIEGAPPVPSENLTEATDDGYNGATTVTLSQSADTTYSWQRSETTGGAFNLDGFYGAAWDVEGGAFLISQISAGEAGAVFNYAYEHTDTKDSSVGATDSLTTTDSLTLSGMFEAKPAIPALGKRWLPKNVGYALVISGMADVFVTKLERTGRMVSYDIRPVEGVPLDVNTITFLINPAYTLNGSLDGMVGSAPADGTFYPHVPAMRSQYGSLYPASYFRLKEAYAIKETIDRQDKERESFFYNFDATQVDQLDKAPQPKAPTVSADGTKASGTSSADDLDAMTKQNDEKKQEMKSEADKRQKEIEQKQSSMEGQTRASAAFADWQLRMGNIQIKAGKRNVVNTYVWDSDGGLRAEEQSFASTIEHSISSESTNSGGIGASVDAAIAGLKFALSVVGSGSKTDQSGKTLSTSKSLALTVDLSGVEKTGITDLRDAPCKPGEKVDRYRFMTFYLEGSTDHFSDFFSYVVDPEWLMSNDEEARALRQAQGARPNKCWRVLHRVTYVERPALMGIKK